MPWPSGVMQESHTHVILWQASGGQTPTTPKADDDDSAFNESQGSVRVPKDLQAALEQLARGQASLRSTSLV